MVWGVRPARLVDETSMAWNEPARSECSLRRGIARVMAAFRRASPSVATAPPAAREPDALDAVTSDELAFFGLVAALRPGFVIMAHRARTGDAHLVVLLRNTAGVSWTGCSMCATTHHGRTAPRPRGRSALSQATPPVANGLWTPCFPATQRRSTPVRRASRTSGIAMSAPRAAAPSRLYLPSPSDTRRELPVPERDDKTLHLLLTPAHAKALRQLAELGVRYRKAADQIVVDMPAASVALQRLRAIAPQ